MLNTQASRYLLPEWPAAKNIHAVVTTRQCGNLATHVNDDPVLVSANRERLRLALALPQEPAWLEQVHGIAAINLDCANPATVGDASYTQSPGVICAMLTADCLPIFLASRHANEVAAIHAGWRGLLAGVIDATITPLTTPAADLLAWMGPAIGPDHFEVGIEVREKFITRHADYASGFRQVNGSWFADIYRLATINLQHCGITAIYGGGLCTVCETEHFYSYRRENGVTGRMASLIWMEPGS